MDIPLRCRRYTLTVEIKILPRNNVVIKNSIFTLKDNQGEDKFCLIALLDTIIACHTLKKISGNALFVFIFNSSLL